MVYAMLSPWTFCKIFHDSDYCEDFALLTFLHKGLSFY